MAAGSVVPMRAGSGASRRRGDVLAAAASEIAARGAIGWRTRDVATPAGVSEAYLFRLYPTKRAILHDVAADAFQRLAQAGPASLTVADGLLLLQLFAACPRDGELRDTDGIAAADQLTHAEATYVIPNRDLQDDIATLRRSGPGHANLANR